MRILLLVLLLFPFAAKAEEDNQISKLCSLVKQEHNPAGADYVPGIDVHGNAVAPADLNTGLGALDPIEIPIKIDLASRYGLDLPADMSAEPEVANIKIFQSGDIEYNDKNITQNIEELCKNHGQDKSNPVPSEKPKAPAETTPQNDKIEGQYP